MGSVLALDELLDHRLEDELDEIAGFLNAQHARLVEVTARLLAHPGTWQVPGIHTIEQYLCWRTGISAAHAHQIAIIARRVDELPECFDTFNRGELSLDQMSAIARKTPAWADHRVAELAPMLTVRQLRASSASTGSRSCRTGPTRTGRRPPPNPSNPNQWSRPLRIRVGSGSVTTAASTCISKPTNRPG